MLAQVHVLKEILGRKLLSIPTHAQSERVLGKDSSQQGHQGVSNATKAWCQMDMFLLLPWWHRNRMDGPAIFHTGAESLTESRAGLQQRLLRCKTHAKAELDCNTFWI